MYTKCSIIKAIFFQILIIFNFQSIYSKLGSFKRWDPYLSNIIHRWMVQYRALNVPLLKYKVPLFVEHPYFNPFFFFDSYLWNVTWLCINSVQILLQTDSNILPPLPHFVQSTVCVCFSMGKVYNVFYRYAANELRIIIIYCIYDKATKTTNIKTK